jgi:flagellar basal-body rod protein FlgB
MVQIVGANMSGLLDNYMRVNETAINLRAQRQELLASNIANADTPNYKARDIDFSKAMDNALARNNVQATALTKTDAAHLDAKKPVDGSSGTNEVQIMYRTPLQPNADSNTVDMDVERNQFADNALHYEAGLTMITAQIKDMLAVIQG